MQQLPHDYEERVYAGVLGKIIGVYLGRPFEGWSYPDIMEKLGEIWYYVHEKLNLPLIVTDDDISGTFTFLRALPDYGNSLDITPEQIGQTWLNYIIENKTILWWGGFGNSTEHTAFLHLKEGIKAPKSGSRALNGKVVSEQIGAQIFIDGWALVAPGDPELAADLARRAASVSHDGEAIYGAQVIAAMEALAFVEPDLNKLLDTAVGMIPKDTVIHKMIADVREWHTKEPDWRKAFQLLSANYGYDKYGGNCHMVPNHGLIVLSLLYGEDNFQKSQMIVNTCGWDTDCNAGNVGCLLGIKNGLAGIDAGPDWRGPVADRLYLPAADGGRSITDAVIESDIVVNMGRVLAGETPTYHKNGARFHFEYSGSVQGFVGSTDAVTVKNVLGHSQKGNRSLALSFSSEGLATTPTFVLPTELGMKGYQLLASPTLYAGQKISFGVKAEEKFNGRLIIHHYNTKDELELLEGPEIILSAGEYKELSWDVPDVKNQPIAEIGVCSSSGTVYLDYLTWSGIPSVTFTRPFGVASKEPWEKPQVWREAWVNSMDHWEPWWKDNFRLIQDDGRGMITQGTIDWGDYAVKADIKPWLIDKAGIAARVQGLKRFYALMITKEKKLVLLKALDGDHMLAEVDFHWEEYQPYQLKLQVEGNTITGFVDGKKIVEVVDEDHPLKNGYVGYVVDEGHINSQAMSVAPLG